MLGQIVTPPEHRVRRFDLADLEREERRCAYRQQGRRTFGSGPNESLVSSGWTPLSEVDLIAWIDMQDASTYTVTGGNAISAIKNKATGVSWTLPVNNTPYEATGLNGHPCLHPIVIGDRIETTEAAVVATFDCPLVAKPYLIAYFAKPDSSTTGIATWGVGNTGVSSQSTRAWGQRSGVATYEYAQTAPSAVATIRSVGAVNTNAVPIVWYSPGVGVHLTVNGNAEDPNNTTTDPSYTPGTGPNRASLFSRPDLAPDSGAIQRFGELIIFPTSKSPTIITNIINYLATKWA